MSDETFTIETDNFNVSGDPSGKGWENSGGEGIGQTDMMLVCSPTDSKEIEPFEFPPNDREIWDRLKWFKDNYKKSENEEFRLTVVYKKEKAESRVDVGLKPREVNVIVSFQLAIQRKRYRV